MKAKKNLPILIFAFLVIGLIPLALFCAPIQNKIPVENRIFVLILLEVIFISLFLNVICSGKMRRVNSQITSHKMLKYFLIFFGVGVASYVFLKISPVFAVLVAIVPLVVFWLRQAFKDCLNNGGFDEKK